MSAPTVYDFIPTIESLRGDRYVFGAEARFDDPHPLRVDCSEATEWSAHRIGIYLPDGARNQWAYCRDHKTLIPLEQGFTTWGALLFRIGVHGDHVAVSLGDGTTFEARGRAYGVNTFPAARRRQWTAAGLVPGLDYSVRIPRLDPAAAPHPQEDDMAPKPVYVPDSADNKALFVLWPDFSTDPTTKEHRNGAPRWRHVSGPALEQLRAAGYIDQGTAPLDKATFESAARPGADLG